MYTGSIISKWMDAGSITNKWMVRGSPPSFWPPSNANIPTDIQSLTDNPSNSHQSPGKSPFITPKDKTNVSRSDRIPQLISLTVYYCHTVGL